MKESKKSKLCRNKGVRVIFTYECPIKPCGLQILSRSTAEYVVFSKFYQSVNDDNSIRNEVNKFYLSFL